MSVQLREPCTRSLRRLSLILKPWPVLLHSPRKTLLIQGNTTNKHPTLFIPIKWNLNSSTRSYTTTAALRIIPEDPAIIESSLIKHNKCKIKNKRTITRLWTQYQTTFLESKHTLDVKQYDVLISALLEKASNSKKPGFWARIIQAFEESTTLDIQPSQNMYLAAIKAYGKIRDLHKVNSLFKEYKKRYKLKPISYEYYLTAVLHCGELNAAHRIFRDININLTMTKSQVSIYLADFVSVCIRKNNVLFALKAVESFHSSDWDKEALDRVTQSLWAGFGSTTSPIDPLSVESFIQMYIEKSKSTTVTDKLWIPSHLFTMFHLLCRNSIVPTTTTCNILLDFADNHLGKVRLVLSTMLELNIEPNNETIDILTRIFGVQNIEGNLYTYFLNVSKSGNDDKKLAEGLRIGNEDKVLQKLYSSNCMDVDCYAVVLGSWIQKGQWNRCIIEYDQLKTMLPDVDTNRQIVKAVLIARIADTNDWSQISNLVKSLKIQFTSTTILRLMNTMIGLENKQGQPLISGKSIAKSLQILESVLEVQLNAEGIGRVITGLGKRGDIENGYRIYNWVRELSPNKERCSNSNIYRALMASATKNNDIRRLERAWVDMQYRKRFLKGCENECKELHSLLSYNILLNGYASRLPRPDLTRVKRLFSRMLKQNMAPDIVTYNILIKAFVNANNMDSANQIFRKMIQSGIKPDTYTTNTILNGWIIKKDWTHVEKLVQELKSSESNHCSNLDIVTFNLIVQSFLQLDSKSMNYTHLLKNQNRWSHIRRLEETNAQKDKVQMPSKKVWTIFESTTGYSEKLITESKFNLQHIKNQQPNGNAFVRLFSNSTEADQITYKLFMKAFVNIGDFKSASKVYQWMRYRLQL